MSIWNLLLPIPSSSPFSLFKKGEKPDPGWRWRFLEIWQHHRWGFIMLCTLHLLPCNSFASLIFWHGFPHGSTTDCFTAGGKGLQANKWWDRVYLLTWGCVWECDPQSVSQPSCIMTLSNSLCDLCALVVVYYFFQVGILKYPVAWCMPYIHAGVLPWVFDCVN